MGAALTQAAQRDTTNLGIYAAAFLATTLGIVYVQDAERQIPITYASRYRAGALQRQSYLPFKVGGWVGVFLRGGGGGRALRLVLLLLLLRSCALAPHPPHTHPTQVNATGVMPVIFSSSLLALPQALARYAQLPALDAAAAALSPSGAFYLPTNVALIAAFNYLYTFLQARGGEGRAFGGCVGGWGGGTACARA